MSTIKPIVYDAANTRFAEQAVVIPPGYIDGLNLVWNSDTSISVTSGSAYIEGAAAVVNMPAALTLSGLSLTASTWYHVYLYLNAGVPAIECVTTAPATAYSGTARSKTGDTSRRYLGSVLTDTLGSIYNARYTGEMVLMRCPTISSTPFRVLNGRATVSTPVSCSGVVPITAISILVKLANLNPSGNGTLRVTNSEASGTPGPPTDEFSNIYAINAGAEQYVELTLSSNQSFNYWIGSGTPTVNAGAFVYGYRYLR